MKHERAPTGAPLGAFDYSKLPNQPAARLRALLARLEALRDEIIEELDLIEGDPDLEPSLGSLGATYHTASDQTLTPFGALDDREDECEDEGGACEDEGADIGDKEPDQFHMCNWQDEGDQTRLRMLPVATKPRRLKSVHQNISGHIAVRAL